MTRDFEDRLRQSLQARAEDVTPDPAMFGEVRSRIRRGRMMRWSLAGAGAVTMVAIAALVFPTLTDRRVEFEPGPVATQPPSDDPERRTSEAFEPGGLVFTDGTAAHVLGTDGDRATEVLRSQVAPSCPVGARCDVLTDVAVDPTSTSSAITAVAREWNGECGQLIRIAASWTGDGGGDLATSPIAAASCPESIAFSPDGRHLVWTAKDTDSDPWLLHAVEWGGVGRAGEDEASFGLDLFGPVDVTIEDWVWTERTNRTAVGYIVLSARDDDGVRVYTQPVERREDGQLVISGDLLEPLGSEEGFAVIAYADSHHPLDGGETAYTLEVTDSARDGRITRRIGGEVSSAVDLPEDLLADPGLDLAELWLSADGDTIVYGDGHGQAWSERFEAGDSTSGGPIDAEVVHADLLPRALAGPDDEAPATTAPEATVEVQVHFTQEGGECGEDLAAYPRTVEGRGVLRGALEHLLAGPTDEDIEAGAAESVFSDATAGALNSVTIADNGVARVDFADFSDRILSTSCMTRAMFAQLDATVKQFPNVEEVVYSFDGSIEDFYSDYQLVAPPHRPDIPLPVTRMQQRIIDALVEVRQDGDYAALAELIDRETFSCSFSDQNEDCIALWQQQEAEGQDPLGPLAEILRGQPAKVEGAPIWAWPVEFVEGDEYLGPRTGIQRDGTWRYYQQGGD